KVTELPTEVAGQLRPSSLSTAKCAMLAWQLRSPLGPSTLCGSQRICPQSGTRCCAQRACRLGGGGGEPGARGGGAATTGGGGEGETATRRVARTAPTVMTAAAMDLRIGGLLTRLGGVPTIYR